MTLVKRFAFMIVALSFTTLAQLPSSAHASLRIDAAEWIVAKFHRADAKLHPHTFNHAWTPYILPEAADGKDLFVQYNGKLGEHESYTIFFKTFADLLDATIQLAEEKQDRVAILNLHSHGLPGGQWLPKDRAALKSLSCHQWKTIADDADAASYRGYYSIPSKDDIEGLRRMGESESVLGCTVGRKQWADLLKGRPKFVASLQPDVQVSFLSCLVGLGKVGARFLQELTAMLVPVNGQGRVQAAVNFGLGDWSMDSGMGFWDYIDDAQLARDTQTYTTTKRDVDVAQPGSLLIGLRSNGQVVTGLLDGVSLMKLTGEIPAPASTSTMGVDVLDFGPGSRLPARAEGYFIPGTTARAYVE